MPVLVSLQGASLSCHRDIILGSYMSHISRSRRDWYRVHEHVCEGVKVSHPKYDEKNQRDTFEMYELWQSFLLEGFSERSHCPLCLWSSKWSTDHLIKCLFVHIRLHDLRIVYVCADKGIEYIIHRKSTLLDFLLEVALELTIRAKKYLWSHRKNKIIYHEYISYWYHCKLF